MIAAQESPAEASTARTMLPPSQPRKPAARALPQLPLKVDAEGYLVAQSDFTVPVGPSYFERDSRNDYKDGDE